MRRIPTIAAVMTCGALACVPAIAETAAFFSSCQVSSQVASGVTSDTIVSNVYRFTYTRDKLFTGGTGQPIGRAVRIPWPVGVEAQAVTTPPPGVTDHHARITLQRVDGQVFDLTAFTAKLLANTYGAGGSIEIMPLLNGQDGLPDPLPFDATGFYGQTFHYDTSPNPWGSTALLHGFDTYQISLYVDFAFVALTLDSAAPVEQACCRSGLPCEDRLPDACTLQGGVPSGAGTSCSCNPCPAPSGPPAVPDGRQGTTPLRAVRSTMTGDTIEVSWDAATCPATDSNLLYGDLNQVATRLPSGAVCSIGTTGSFVWSAVPQGNLYFLVVATDGAGTEGSWGLDSAGQERNGAAASGFCGVTLKNASRPCP